MRLNMAYANNSRTTSLGLVDRFSAFMATAKVNAAKRRIYEKTVRELNALTDRELTDLGISRVSVEDVARVAAYGA
jgi:uncharacterized protein YjiS (DUF1127 family)